MPFALCPGLGEIPMHAHARSCTAARAVESLLAKFQPNGSGKIERLQREALALYQSSCWPDVKKIMEQILELAPANVLALELSGANYLIEKWFVHAIPIDSKRTAIVLQAPNAGMNCAIALTVAGKIELAIKGFNSTISRNQKHAKSYYDRDSALITLRRFNLAIADSTMAITHNPNSTAALAGKFERYSVSLPPDRIHVDP
jgi:tetratricopeptide (TPR) repeat protein